MWYWGALLSKTGKLTLKEDGVGKLTCPVKLHALPDKKAKSIVFDLGFCKDDPHKICRETDGAYLIIENEFYHFEGMQYCSYINNGGHITVTYFYKYCTCGEMG